MEVGPTTHYMMGGIRVDGDTQMSTVLGLFAAGEVAAGLHGANRLGGNSLSDLLVFGKRAGDYAAKFASTAAAPRLDPTAVDTAARQALEPFAASASGNGAISPFQIQHELQASMQDLVGIVRNEADMTRALGTLSQLNAQAAHVAVSGNREFNPGWHTALDIRHQLIVAEAVTRSAIERKESRGAQFREDFPEKGTEYGRFNIVVRRGTSGAMELSRRPIPPLPPELAQVIEEMK